MGKGGKIEGAGRKTKADEERSRHLAIAAITRQYGSLEKGLMTLLESGESALVKFVFEHALGKPKETHEVGLNEDTVNIIMSRVKDGR
jgi:hypothetical protein